MDLKDEVKNRYTDVFLEALYEVTRQHKKWGIQNHNVLTWLAILGEEVGEANKAVLEAKYGTGILIDYRTEMIQVAAVALSAIECLDRLEGANEKR